MPLTLEDALADMQAARQYLNRHVTGVSAEQWDAKPFDHVNSGREIFGHLLATVRSVREMLSGEPFAMTRHVERHKEAAVEIASLAPADILALHDAEGEALIALVRQKFAGAELDTPVTLWTQEAPLGLHLGHISQEMAYHTGQVSLLRQAMVPDWDYFGDVFGMPTPAIKE
jgi:uncharacterized damage-inducible protein DinB